ncbi:carboxylesterase [Trichosporon asahii var. asahii CBS 2479]|uniref:S-formylglutathione hydrolase n=1 Tax=Trichosporon asahii var. asahii (strain ATCC 90039 / CBS 2479 / JCM 2466 / KCTC 7840 / NBRC 103889/ NCYC 2677 / UAMH 7654) TaxID=1186058 RepID=J4UEY0_TRIAS|nr:carboxylesterase [Trichosporon asahii var. asahii CBS 2479]EJT49870.1 carboxylesterase [Trichosporon asahii var. asahii CBS 2479]
MSSLKSTAENRVANGTLTKYTVPSKTLGLDSPVNVFIPPGFGPDKPAPVLFYLAGLTCTEDTGAQKGGFFNTAAKEGIALVFPDTSPRGAGVEGEDDDWQLGTGAGFYIDATNEKWKHYNMYSFITKELPEVLAPLGLDFKRWSITGHSMGGHGALTIYLKDPTRFKSCSAFAPICNPAVVPWGKGAFGAYLNTRTRSNPPAEWLEHDASHLLQASQAPKGSLHMLVDVGTADKFLKDGQLEPQALERAAKDRGAPEELDLRMQDGYDHSYYFISTFSPEHVQFHAKYLKA